MGMCDLCWANFNDSAACELSGFAELQICEAADRAYASAHFMTVDCHVLQHSERYNQPPVGLDLL